MTILLVIIWSQIKYKLVFGSSSENRYSSNLRFKTQIAITKLDVHLIQTEILSISSSCINYWGIEEGVNYIFGSQHHLSDVNSAFKITYRTRMWLSNILTRQYFSYWRNLLLFWLWGWVPKWLRNMCTLSKPWTISVMSWRGGFKVRQYFYEMLQNL